MSKTKALAWTVASLATGIFFLIAAHSIACMACCLLPAAGFGFIAYRKIRRDQELIAGAMQAQLDQPQVQPMMTSKNVQGRLFVPPPIDRTF